MKKKNSISFYPVVLLAALLILTSSCKKDETPGNPTNGKTEAVFNSSLTYGTMTDQDGNIYKTIAIGTQTWMAENLRTTKYRNGDAIPEVTSELSWSALNTGAYCNYLNTENLDTISTYGRLYNWFVVSDIRNIAPIGWHVPAYAEWKTLTDYLGDILNGGKLKESGTIHWLSPNVGTMNETGFTAIPGGDRINGFWQIGRSFSSWTSTASSSSYSFISIYNNSSEVYYVYTNGPSSGFSIRCIKD